MATCRWTHVYYLWRPNLPDEADNHILELAVAGNATAVITHNTRDFNRGELIFPDIQILKPNQLLEN
jgi:predicted nucleic acid-binding protein